jgi:hypothetical protein
MTKTDNNQLDNKSNVDQWIARRTSKQVKALEKASKVFDDNDNLTVNSLEAIYGKESSFGSLEYLKKSYKGLSGPAGHFQQKKEVASEKGLITKATNDQRFDIDESSISAAQQLKSLDNYFRKKTNLGSEIFTIPIANKVTREIFVIASYNIGQGRIAKAQALAKASGRSPSKWVEVAEFLIAAGAKKEQVAEVLNYVEKVLEYKKEFAEKSQANKKLKDKDLKEVSLKKEGRWVTIENNRVLIANNKLS